MAATTNQWIRVGLAEVFRRGIIDLDKGAEIIASHAPQSSPDICENCGQEVIDGHFSLVCHKPTCIAALRATEE